MKPAKAAGMLALLGCLALAACGNPEQGPAVQGIYDDRFSPFVEIEGVSVVINPLGGTAREWHLRSLVDKTTHEVVHTLYFFATGPGAARRFVAAADDTAAALPVGGIEKGRPCRKCDADQAVLIYLDAATLASRRATGYAVKVGARDGTSYVLDLTPPMIQAQLAAVDRVLAATARASALQPSAYPPIKGLHVRNLLPGNAMVQRDPAIRGVEVVTVDPPAAAGPATIMPGDIVTDFDGAPVASVDEFIAALAKAGTGRLVTIGGIHQGTGGRFAVQVKL